MYNEICIDSNSIYMKGLYSEKEVIYRTDKVYSTRWLAGERLEKFFRVYPDGTLEIQSLE